MANREYDPEVAARSCAELAATTEDGLRLVSDDAS
jgi:hypothetical protein